jgi:CRP/FNR family transcriptional regulator
MFKGLSLQEIEALFTGVMLRECSPGTVFFAPEDSSERLFILKTGQVELYRLTADGKRLVTRRIGPGTIFGEMGLLGQSLQGCFAEATEHSLVCVATRDDILRLLQARPEVMLRLLEVIGNRLNLLEGRLEQAVFSPVKVRLANFLLANLDPATGVVAGYSHAEIGDTIGALRQTVTETLNGMASQSLLVVARKQIQVTNRQRLEEMALGDGA